MALIRSVPELNSISSTSRPCFIQPCLVGDHGTGIVHHPDVTYLELFLRLRERTQEHKSRNQPELRFHFDLDSDSQRI